MKLRKPFAKQSSIFLLFINLYLLIQEYFLLLYTHIQFHICFIHYICTVCMYIAVIKLNRSFI